jgi:hypothetical protein
MADPSSERKVLPKGPVSGYLVSTAHVNYKGASSHKNLGKIQILYFDMSGINNEILF